MVNKLASRNLWPLIFLAIFFYFEPATTTADSSRARVLTIEELNQLRQRSKNSRLSQANQSKLGIEGVTKKLAELKQKPLSRESLTAALHLRSISTKVEPVLEEFIFNCYLHVGNYNLARNQAKILLQITESPPAHKFLLQQALEDQKIEEARFHLTRSALGRFEKEYYRIRIFYLEFGKAILIVPIIAISLSFGFFWIIRKLVFRPIMSSCSKPLSGDRNNYKIETESLFKDFKPLQLGIIPDPVLPGEKSIHFHFAGGIKSDSGLYSRNQRFDAKPFSENHFEISISRSKLSILIPSATKQEAQEITASVISYPVDFHDESSVSDEKILEPDPNVPLPEKFTSPGSEDLRKFNESNNAQESEGFGKAKSSQQGLEFINEKKLVLPKLDFGELSGASEKFPALSRDTRTLLKRIRALKSGIIGITSSSDFSERASVSTLLGVFLAKQKRKTLLIDADFTRPLLNLFTEIPCIYGLKDLLRSQKGSENIEIKTELENLSILPSGTPDERAQAQMNQDFWKRNLAILKQKYESLIIVLPPLKMLKNMQLHNEQIMFLTLLNADKEASINEFFFSRIILKSYNFSLFQPVNARIDESD